MSKFTIIKRISVIVLPIISLVLLYFLALYVVNNFQLPICFTYAFTGIYCPGCGATRSVVALLHGDIFHSIRENALVIVGIMYLLMLYIEVVLKVFGKKFRFPIHSNRFIYTSLIVAGVYVVLRNFIPAIAPI